MSQEERKEMKYTLAFHAEDKNPTKLGIHRLIMKEELNSIQIRELSPKGPKYEVRRVRS